MRLHISPIIAPLSLLALSACAAVRPAHFVDAAPIVEVADDGPIPIPERRDPVHEVVISEAYLRRPVVRAMDPVRVPEGGDVNALDEVPRSSWFWPGASTASPDAAPMPPLDVLGEPPMTDRTALAVTDARGRRFEISRDPVDRPEMRSAAAAISSRLLGAIGYYVADASVVEFGDDTLRASSDAARDRLVAFLREGAPRVGGRLRVSAVRWPLGIDLGPTPPAEARRDDPNDRVAHPDRRTLRALKTVFGWLGITRVTPGLLRDTYVGASGRGHVVHYLVGLGGALGADAVVRAEDDLEAPDQNVWITLGSLGLMVPRVKLTQTRRRAIGEYNPAFSVREFMTSPPLEPIDRTLPSDAYWAAKRIAAIRAEAITAAVAAGKIGDESARKELHEVIEARRTRVVWSAFTAVTPCEVERVERDTLVLRDEAIARGLVGASDSRYRVEIADERGVLVKSAVVAPKGREIRVALPDGAFGYRVVQVLVVRGARAAPRAMEVHLIKKGEAPARVVGIRR